MINVTLIGQIKIKSPQPAKNSTKTQLKLLLYKQSIILSIIPNKYFYTSLKDIFQTQ